MMDICYMCITETYQANAYVQVEKSFLDEDGSRMDKENIPIYKGRSFILNRELWYPTSLNNYSANISHVVGGIPTAFVELAYKLGDEECWWGFNNSWNYKPFQVSSLFGMPVCANHTMPAIDLWRGKKSYL